MSMVPRAYFLTEGAGAHVDKIHSFELALRQAGVSAFNLVKVSSIIPPGCRRLTREQALRKLRPGQIVFCVMSEHAIKGQSATTVASAVGWALPAAQAASSHGYLAEYRATDTDERDVALDAERLARDMLASLLPGGEDSVGRSGSVVAEAAADPTGRWTTTVALAVFVL